nr:hypothetical protein GCM10020092_060900 [Actinoplanes digitatis]
MRTRISRGARRAVAAIAALGLVAAMAACGSDDETPSGSGAVTAEGVDDGAELALWTRAPLELQAKALVDAYNKSHKNQVKLTIVPNDDYVAKVGAAAGSGDLPDLFAADIVYVPNWTKAGLFSDITEHIGKLPYADKLNQGHISAGTRDGAKYVLPFVLDLSVIFYNKDLYREARPRPGEGPDHARGVQAAGARRAEAEQARHLRHLLRRQLRRLQRLHLVPDGLGQRRGGHEPRGHQVPARRPRRAEGVRHLA